MGMMYLSGRKEVDYETFKKVKEQIFTKLKELGFKVEGENAEVFVRYEE